jgi:membrane protein DedA with SNARE-associated domain
MELVQYWVQHYGYAGIFSLMALGIVGLPVPDETLLALAGYLVYRGDLCAIPTALAAILGATCGITVSYVLGLTTGYYVLDRFGKFVHITPQKLDHVHLWLRRFGGLMLTFGYYFPGLRHLTAYVAGASRLEYLVFAAFAYSGALLWTLTFIAFGYYLGERWHDGISRIQSVVLICCLIALTVMFVWIRTQHRNRKK